MTTFEGIDLSDVPAYARGAAAVALKAAEFLVLADGDTYVASLRLAEWMLAPRATQMPPVEYWIETAAVLAVLVAKDSEEN